MTRSSRVVLAGAALLLLVVFRFPLWRISLEAPQYPEGLGLRIWVNTIAGAGPHDLRNINNLNHYIGMKPIEPDAIPELTLMPWIAALLVVSGLAAAAAGRRWMLCGWFGLLAVLAVAGMVDFWLWGYDYGHNLDPHAAIKVPGMSYQPPLVGSKTLLNFKAHSWPDVGGWAALVAGVLAAGACARELRRRREAASSPTSRGENHGCGTSMQGGDGQRKPDEGAQVRPSSPSGSGGPREGLVAEATPTPRTGPSLGALRRFWWLVAMAGACAPQGPVPVKIGEDTCSHCLMTIADPRYATELITRKGVVHTFDSVECLASFLLTGKAGEMASLWVTDFENPPAMVRAESAMFLHSPHLPSPMGMNLTAFAPDADTAAILAKYPGELLDWQQVLALVGGRRDIGPSGTGHGGHGTEGW